MLVATALLAALFARFNWSDFFAILERVPLSFYCWSLALLFVAQIPYALKWWAVLGRMGIRVSAWQVFEQYMIALFFANFLPGALGGDASKVYYLGQRSGYLSVGVSVLMDRGLSLLMVMILATIAFWLIEDSSPLYSVARLLLTLSLLAGLSVFLSVVFLSLPRWLRVERMSDWLGVSRARRIVGVLEAVRLVGRSPVVTGSILLVVVGYYALVALIYREFFVLTTGAQVAPLSIMVALLGISVFSNLPVTINGIGVREHLHTALFASAGVSTEAAVGVSLLLFSQLLVLSLLGFVLWARLQLGRKLDCRRPAADRPHSAGEGLDAESDVGLRPAGCATELGRGPGVRS